MKKFFTVLAAFLCAVAGALALAACVGGSKPSDKPNGDNLPDEYTVTFDGNGGKFEKGDVELGDGVTVDDGTVVSDDGTKLTLKVKKNGAFIEPLKTPFRDGTYAFCGWAKDQAGETLWNFDTDRLSSDLTLYAVWTVTFDFKLSDDQSYYAVRGIGGLSGDVEIPETHNKKPVREILPNAFKNESKLTGIVIPNSIITIGRAAFERCNNLLNVELGEGVNVLPEETFAECSKLEKISLPSSLKKIGEQAFSECDALAEVRYDGSVDEWCGIEIAEYIILNQNYHEPANPLSNGKAKLYANGEAVTSPVINATKIKPYAFYGCGTLQSVTVSGGVDEIGYKAFSGCNFSSLKLSLGIKSIGEQAFYRNAVTQITVPSSVTTVGKQAFAECEKLTSVTVNAKSVGESAFAYCYALATLNLQGVEEIGEQAFTSCSDALASVTVPDSAWYLGSGCFSSCDALAGVTFSGSAGSANWYVTTVRGYEQVSETVTGDMLDTPQKAAKRIKENGIWMRSFGEPTFTLNSDKSSYTLSGFQSRGVGALIVPAEYEGKPVTAIGNVLREDRLKALSIPATVEAIYTDLKYCTGLQTLTVDEGNSAFRVQGGILYDRALTKIVFVPKTISGSIVIADGVTEIATSAFENCTGLTGVTVPDSVKTIGYGAFKGCDNLVEMTLPFIGYKDYNYGNDYGGSGDFGWIFGSKSSSDDTKLSIQTVVITNATYINAYAFYKCVNVTNIFLPDGLIYIGDRAFLGCTGLTNLTIPDSVTSIGDYAFHGCNGLTSVTLPNSVTTIGERTFYDCSSLTSVTIPNGVTSIGNYAFCGCSGLTSITIPNSVTSIGDYAFSRCSGLTSITIPNSVTSIGNYIFKDCNRLTSVTIPDNVTSIGTETFRGCSSLTSITIPNSVTSIGYQAFYDCTALTSVKIDNGIASIGNFAFGNCSALTSIMIPDSVTSIGESAFYGCNSLTKIVVSENNTAYVSQDGILYNKAKTEIIHIPKVIQGEITIPNGVTTIDWGAFQDCIGLTGITIPNSVTFIDVNAFGHCDNLTNIIFQGTKAEWKAIKKRMEWHGLVNNYTIQCTDGKLDQFDNEIA